MSISSSTCDILSAARAGKRRHSLSDYSSVPSSAASHSLHDPANPTSASAHAKALSRIAKDYTSKLDDPSSRMESFLDTLRSTRSEDTTPRSDSLTGFLRPEHRDLLSIGAARPVITDLLRQGRYSDVDLLHGYLASMTHPPTSHRSWESLVPDSSAPSTLPSTASSDTPPPAYTVYSDASGPPSYHATTRDTYSDGQSIDTDLSRNNTDPDCWHGASGNRNNGDTWSPYPSTPATAPRRNTYSWADMSSGSNPIASASIGSTAVTNLPAALELHSRPVTRPSELDNSTRHSSRYEVEGTSRSVYELDTDKGSDVHELATEEGKQSCLQPRYVNRSEDGSLDTGPSISSGLVELPAGTSSATRARPRRSRLTKNGKSLRFASSMPSSSQQSSSPGRRRRSRIRRAFSKFLTPITAVTRSSATSNRPRATSRAARRSDRLGSIATTDRNRETETSLDSTRPTWSPNQRTNAPTERSMLPISFQHNDATALSSSAGHDGMFTLSGTAAALATLDPETLHRLGYLARAVQTARGRHQA